MGLVKTAVAKTIGNAYLTFDELKEVFLDVEIALLKTMHNYQS